MAASASALVRKVRKAAVRWVVSQKIRLLLDRLREDFELKKVGEFKGLID